MTGVLKQAIHGVQDVVRQVEKTIPCKHINMQIHDNALNGSKLIFQPTGQSPLLVQCNVDSVTGPHTKCENDQALLMLNHVVIVADTSLKMSA